MYPRSYLDFQHPTLADFHYTVYTLLCPAHTVRHVLPLLLLILKKLRRPQMLYCCYYLSPL